MHEIEIVQFLLGFGKSIGHRPEKYKLQFSKSDLFNKKCFIEQEKLVVIFITAAHSLDYHPLVHVPFHHGHIISSVF